MPIEHDDLASYTGTPVETGKPSAMYGTDHFLSQQTATAIVKGAGKKYRRTTRTLAVRMDQPFAVDTGHGIADGKPGDYLALDADGMPYPISAEVFGASYAEVGRKRGTHA